MSTPVEPSVENITVSNTINHNDHGQHNNYQTNNFIKCNVTNCEK